MRKSRPSRPVAVGDWMNLGNGDRLAALRKLRRESPHPDKTRILAYLRSGSPVMGGPTRVPDLLDPRRPGLPELRYLTDGVWVWTNEVAYYVEHENIELSEEFVDDMRKNDWQVPSARS